VILSIHAEGENLTGIVYYHKDFLKENQGKAGGGVGGGLSKPVQSGDGD
jgi:hypothetical protein